MKAIIPVAGIGTRLRPHTHTAPKALLHVAGKPILGHILDELLAFDIRDIVFIIGFLGEKIVDYVSSNYRIRAEFVEQKELFGLGWAIYLARDYFGDGPILIILGDTIFDINLEEILASEWDAIGTKAVSDPRRFGIAETDGRFVTRLVEKPENPTSNLAITGIYYIKSTALLSDCLKNLVERNITTRGEFQLTDALGLMLEAGCRIATFDVEGWYDCGEKESLLETNRYLLSQIKTVPNHPEAIIVPPVYISPTAKVKNSVIGPFVSVADEAVIENSIIRNSIISSQAEVRQCLLESSLIGDSSLVVGTYNKLNLGHSSEFGYY